MMDSSATNASERLNEYAVVAYVPPPLGPVLDGMRKELAPWMPPGRSHLTILQPRPIRAAAAEVWADLKKAADGFEPLQIATGEIEVFEETGVVYLSIESGWPEIERLHRSMNRNGASYREPFPFHPHITIAQGIEPGELAAVRERAREMWEEAGGPRRFEAGTLHFVQNTIVNLWIDLCSLELSANGRRQR